MSSPRGTCSEGGDQLEAKEGQAWADSSGPTPGQLSSVLRVPTPATLLLCQALAFGGVPWAIASCLPGPHLTPCPPGSVRDNRWEDGRGPLLFCWPTGRNPPSQAPMAGALRVGPQPVPRATGPASLGHRDAVAALFLLGRHQLPALPSPQRHTVATLPGSLHLSLSSFLHLAPSLPSLSLSPSLLPPCPPLQTMPEVMNPLAPAWPRGTPLQRGSSSGPVRARAT